MGEWEGCKSKYEASLLPQQRRKSSARESMDGMNDAGLVRDEDDESTNES